MRIARSTGAISGLLIAVLGIWGALAPFIGPYFDYSFGANTAWHYTTDRLLLSILPGAAAFIGGLLVMRAASRPGGALGAWLAMLGGVWFGVGAALSRVWEHANSPIGAPLFGSTRQALELIGCFYGLGIAIVALAAFAAGRFVSRPPLAVVGDEWVAEDGAARGAAPPADRHQSAHPRRRLVRRGAQRRSAAATDSSVARESSSGQGTTSSTREL